MAGLKVKKSVDNKLKGKSDVTTWILEPKMRTPKDVFTIGAEDDTVIE